MRFDTDERQYTWAMAQLAREHRGVVASSRGRAVCPAIELRIHAVLLRQGVVVFAAARDRVSRCSLLPVAVVVRS